MPSSRTSKFLISDAPGHLAQRLLTGYNGIRRRRTAWQRQALGLYLRTDLPRRPVGDRVSLLLPDRADQEAWARLSFPAHLRKALGDPAALLAVGMRQLDDHHAKPTFQLFTAHGEPRAYAKIGWSAPTAPMVRHEAAALRRLEKSGLPQGIIAPSPTHVDQWDGHPYLVLEPLPADVHSLGSWESPRWASRALAGRTWRSPVTASAWYRALRSRLESLDSRSSALAEAAHRAAAVLSSHTDEWEFGAWHGDWAWWNVGQSGGHLHVWDWEHFEECAPLGFDDLHWSVSVDLELRGLSLRKAIVLARGALATQQAADQDLFVLAYLTEMAVRSCEVSLHGTGALVELHAGLLEELRALTAARL